MRYPLQSGTNPGDDVDGLQADVMRFIAIFGLCLAAIFSLVREVEHDYATAEAREPAAVAPAVTGVTGDAFHPRSGEPQTRESQSASSLEPRTAQPVTTSVPTPVQQPRPVPEPELPDPAAPAPETSERERGFSLQFESSAVLHALMLQGAIQVYARSGDTYRLMDGTGRLREARPPAAYYGMDSATLPESIRVAGAGLGELEGVEWVVTLPERTARGIVGLMGVHDNGVLVIGADASVRRDEPH